MLHVPKESLPIRLGGTLDIDHSSWLLHCYKSMTNREDDVCLSTQTNSTAATATNISNSTIPTTIQEITQQQHQSQQLSPLTINNSINATTNNHNNIVNNDINLTTTTGTGTGDNNLQHHLKNNHNHHNNSDCLNNHDQLNNQNGQFVGCEQTNNLHNHSNGAPALSELWSENPPSSASSGFSDDDSLAGTEGDPKTIEQIVEMVNKLGRDGLIQEYANIRAKALEGSFTNAK